MATIKIKSGAILATEEWRIKEFGSWEDHGCSADHVCAILEREMHKTHFELSRDEAEKLLESAKYQMHWDRDNEYLIEIKFFQVINGYINRLQKAL